MRNSRTLVAIAAFLLALCATPAAAGNRPARPPEDISNIPRMLGGGPRPRVMSRDLHAFGFELKTPRVLPGELVWGEIEYRNIGKEPNVLSRPYRGGTVVTLEIWVSRVVAGGEGDMDGAIEWSKPRLIGSLSEKYVSRRMAHYIPFVEPYQQGWPLLVAPGDSYRVAIPLNVRQNIFEKTREFGPFWTHEGWTVGVVTHAPGRYRFYLRYVNLYGEFPYRDDGDGLDDVIAQHRDRGERFATATLGPYEVEVLEPPAELAPVAEALAEALTPYEDDIADSWVDRRGNYLYCERARALLRLPALKDDKRREIATSLELGALREELVGWRQISNDMFHEWDWTLTPEWYRDAEARLRAMNDPGLPKPLRDAIEMTRVWVLLASGQRQQAIETAQRLGTPDAVVFVKRLRHEDKIGPQDPMRLAVPD